MLKEIIFKNESCKPLLPSLEKLVTTDTFFFNRVSKNKWKLLIRVKILLEKNNIPFWVESGTLLGFVRDKRFLDHSKKIHLGIHAADLEKVISLCRKLGSWYKAARTYERTGREWITGNINALYIKPVIKSNSNDFRLYITPRFKKESNVRWIDGVDGWVCKSAASRYIETLDSLTVNKVQLLIPHDAEQYLHDRYGVWQTPVTQWDANRDDRAIISGKILKSLPRKTRWTRPQKHTKKMMLTGKNLKRAKRLLADTADVLNRHGIHWWLDHGTLLGVIRNNELIPYDHDIDVCARGSDAEKFLSIQNSFSPKYRVSLRYENSGRLPGRLRVAKIKFLLGRRAKFLSEEELHLDIFFNYDKGDGYSYWMDSCTVKRVPVHFYEKLERVTWDNRTYPVPCNTEEYLTCRFGDWRTPVQKYDSSLDDQSIFED